MANLAPLAETTVKPWPVWAKGLASAVIGWQLASLLAAELGQEPASPVEHAIAERFTPYYQFVDQGVSHRFYSDIGPTPILLAELTFRDGRPPRRIRIPDRSTRPRVLYQRELALANEVLRGVEPSLRDPTVPMDIRSAHAIARRLCRQEASCSGVSIFLQMHHNPDPHEWIDAATIPYAPAVNPDSEQYYTVPRRLGDFPCPSP